MVLTILSMLWEVWELVFCFLFKILIYLIDSLVRSCWCRSGRFCFQGRRIILISCIFSSVLWREQVRRNILLLLLSINYWLLDLATQEIVSIKFLLNVSGSLWMIFLRFRRHQLLKLYRKDLTWRFSNSSWTFSVKCCQLELRRESGSLYII